MQAKLFKHVIAIATIASATTVAFAGEAYVFGAVGASNYTGNGKSEIDAALVGAGATGLRSSMSNSSTGYKAGLGYQFNPNFAIEGSYVDVGSFKYSATTTNVGAINAEAKGSGLNFSALGIAPINDNFSVFGKVGYTSLTVKSSAAVAGISVNGSEDKNSASFGFGGIYKLTDKVGVRVEWEQLYSDVNMFTVGLQAKF